MAALVDGIRDRFAEDPALFWLFLLFALIVVMTIVFVYAFVFRPARRTIATMRGYRADFARDLLRRVPVSDMSFIAESVRLLVSDLSRKEAELQELYRHASARAEVAERRSEHVLESIPSGILAFDLRGRVSAANAAASRMCGRSARELLGRPAAEALAAVPGASGWIRAALERGATVDSEELSMKGAGGEHVPASLSTSLLRDGAGAVAGCTCLLTDVSRVRELEERVALKERLAAIGELSAGLAHELRNPLAAIVGYAKLLSDGSPSAGPKDPARVIQAEAMTLDRLVRDFLDFARPLALSAAEFRPKELLERAREAVQAQAERAGVSLFVESPADDVRMRGDPERMQQAVENLLRNAVEASLRGGRVRMSARVSPERSEAELSVSDAGPGVAPDLRRRLFTPFFSTKKTGVGMGLALVQKIASAHGGRVEHEPVPGGGARFVLRLPLSGPVPRARAEPVTGLSTAKPARRGARGRQAASAKRTRSRPKTSRSTVTSR